MNILYQVDACGVPFDEALGTALEFADLSELDTKNGNRSEEARVYASAVVNGVKANLGEIDGYIMKLAQGWPPDRQPAVDRNILRIAIYEIIYVDSVPPVVAVDEAVELAKKYSTGESGKFVNGVLAGFLREHKSQQEEEDQVGS